MNSRIREAATNAAETISPVSWQRTSTRQDPATNALAGDTTPAVFHTAATLLGNSHLEHTLAFIDHGDTAPPTAPAIFLSKHAHAPWQLAPPTIVSLSFLRASRAHHLDHEPCSTALRQIRCSQVTNAHTS
jgi:hypothetical protein